MLDLLRCAPLAMVMQATAKVNVLIEGEYSDNQPVITMPEDVEVNTTGLFTRVNLGFAQGC